MRNRMVNVITTTCAAVFAWFFWSMALDTRSPIIVEDGPRVLNTEPVPRNGTLRVEYVITVLRSCSGEGQRIFTDSGGTQFPAQPFSSSSGHRDDGQPVVPGKSFTAVVEVPVPFGMAPGRAAYLNETFFYCNVWQRLLSRGIDFNYPPVVFDVGTTTIDAPPPPPRSLFRHSQNRLLPWEWFRRRVWNVGDYE